MKTQAIITFSEEMEKLKTELGLDEREFINAGLTLLAWAATQVKEGKEVASVDESTSSYKTLDMVFLRKIKIL